MKIIVIPSEQTPRVSGFRKPIKEYIEMHREKLNAFLEYAKTRTDAAGLAANQVAIDDVRFAVRAFAIKGDATQEWKLVIDPVIVEEIGMVDTKVEGCLTWKDKFIIAERHRAVKVTYYDMDGCPHKETHKGFIGQVWQHEINHLNGVEEDVRDSMPVVRNNEVGRNEPCPCGSGLKYKKCCLNLI